SHRTPRRWSAWYNGSVARKRSRVRPRGLRDESHHRGHDLLEGDGQQSGERFIGNEIRESHYRRHRVNSPWTARSVLRVEYIFPALLGRAPSGCDLVRRNVVGAEEYLCGERGVC